MPEPLHPPYGIGSVPPRQLNRWLDVNSQNGPLTRTRGYVSLPAFNIAGAGRTYSEIVGVFSYTATNNFSVKNYKNLTNNGSYSLCIAYADSDRTVHRFMLIKGTNDNNLSFPPMYAGQLIKKKFRLEIWDGVTLFPIKCQQIDEIKIFSTVLGQLDYRYGQDFVLGSAAVLCTSQNLTNALQFYVTPPQVGLEVWLENHEEQQYITFAAGTKVAIWQDRSHNVTAYVAPIGPANEPDFLPDTVPGTKYKLRFLSQQWLTGIMNGSLQQIFILATPDIGGVASHKILTVNDGGGRTLEVYSDGTPTGNWNVNFNGNIIQTQYGFAPQNQVHLLEINTVQEYINLWDGLTGIKKSNPGNIAGFTLTPNCNIVLGDQAGAVDGFGTNIYGVLGYSTALVGLDRELAIQYMLSLAAGMHSYISPLTFAPCTVLTPNT